MYKIIDISIPHENGATEPYPPTLEFSDHRAGAARLSKLAGVTPDAFPGGMALATDRVSGSSHSGTHVDAPWHYAPECEGKPSKTVDQVPLEWCFGPGVLLDMRHKEPGSEITAEDMRQELERIHYTLRPGDIVLLHTGCDRYWGTDTKTYLAMQSGLGIRGLDWLLDQGIHCIGMWPPWRRPTGKPEIRACYGQRTCMGGNGNICKSKSCAAWRIFRRLTASWFRHCR